MQYCTPGNSGYTKDERFSSESDGRWVDPRLCADQPDDRLNVDTDKDRNVTIEKK